MERERFAWKCLLHALRPYGPPEVWQASFGPDMETALSEEEQALLRRASGLSLARPSWMHPRAACFPSSTCWTEGRRAGCSVRMRWSASNARRNRPSVQMKSGSGCSAAWTG